MILPYRDFLPQAGKGAWVAPNATFIGDVEIGADVSIWFGTVVRGDVHSIRIGARTNIQDNSLIHTTHHEGEGRSLEDGYPAIIGSDVTVGHNVILHGCTVEDLCLIGMGAIILDGALIQRESIVGAGAVVTGGKKFPPRSLILGSPAKAVRELSEEEVQGLHASWKRYVDLKNEYHQALVGHCF
ncbi:gamma carbonic anhydrase family protein [Desulfogranum mediterraneum]|uniref:gamma carbonic anhydrase family protein n=1 Tax=Desulfogranum mediterraneum TaxID=160661 RepID=UPI0003F50514|nr:gamma carbonic anhydrase family protein [Desulfogranum mediterraneum]